MEAAVKPLRLLFGRVPRRQRRVSSRKWRATRRERDVPHRSRHIPPRERDASTDAHGGNERERLVPPRSGRVPPPRNDATGGERGGSWPSRPVPPPKRRVPSRERGVAGGERLAADLEQGLTGGERGTKGGRSLKTEAKRHPRRVTRGLLRFAARAEPRLSSRACTSRPR